MRLETLAVHAGRRVDPTTGAVTPAIHPSTTFEREPDGSYPRGFLYTRNANPNRNALEECLAALEGGEAAAAFASGSAATSAVFLALQPGDHVVAPTDAYHGTSRLLRETFSRWGLEATFVDMTDVAAVRRAITPSTRLVWVETPSNPLWKVTDIAAIGALARAASARYVCENALRVATFLARHARVEAVHYPGLPSHPGHDIARRQMAQFGGMVSVRVKGDRDRALAVAAKVRVFTRATSFGGTESLVEHRASIEGTGTTTPETLLRLSIGLENADDLIEDLDQALA